MRGNEDEEEDDEDDSLNVQLTQGRMDFYYNKVQRKRVKSLWALPWHCALLPQVPALNQVGQGVRWSCGRKEAGKLASARRSPKKMCNSSLVVCEISAVASNQSINQSCQSGKINKVLLSCMYDQGSDASTVPL